jgi:hypothetical protein
MQHLDLFRRLFVFLGKDARLESSGAHSVGKGKNFDFNHRIPPLDSERLRRTVGWTNMMTGENSSKSHARTLHRYGVL